MSMRLPEGARSSGIIRALSKQGLEPGYARFDVSVVGVPKRALGPWTHSTASGTVTCSPQLNVSLRSFLSGAELGAGDRRHGPS